MATNSAQTSSKPKPKYKVRNWSEYNKAFVQRGSVTFWLDTQAINHWEAHEPNGRRGRDNQFSEHAIVTALMIQAVFGMSLRQTEGFINSIFSLMGIALKSPTYSSISKRAKTVDVDIRRPKGPVAHLVFDATGLKVYGEGEWKMRKHGKEKRRTWRKLHLGVDAQSHAVICADMSVEGLGDNQALPTMFRPLRRKIGTVYGDGAYDTKQCFNEIIRKHATPCIPPRSNAGYWKGNILEMRL